MNNFIGTYDNVLTTDECSSVVKYFEEMRKYNLVYSRQEFNDGLAHHKMDETCFLMDPEVFYLESTHPVLSLMLDKVWKCYKDYIGTYSILQESQKQVITSVRLQKTVPGGGYHDWHYESNGKAHSHRVLAFMVYLNDVVIGGETEFLYQHLRVSPAAGRVVIWPATFTHAHRGNQPISGVKYIATGWIEFA